MRRSLSGGGSANQRWHQNSPGAFGGSMMTDHLGLQDIDKELELLKRKREIIEQQQQILSSEFRRNDYQEPFSQSSRFDEYAESYENARDYNPPSRKRPISVWEHDAPNKRFAGPVRPKTRPYSRPGIPPLMRSGPFTGYQGSLPRHQRPLSGPFKPKPPKKDVNPPKKDANPPKKNVIPPKVAKAAAAAPIKPKNPAADRKKVTEAIDLTSEGATPAASAASDLNRLCPDREPSNQLTGRLELALGSIITEMKATADPSVLRSAAVMRDIKTIVRDRIRELMMNQIVGPATAIKARYREVYDQQSDCEVVANALDAQTGQVTMLKIDQAIHNTNDRNDPERYFKSNMHRIMQWKLKSLLDKLEETARVEAGIPTGSGEAPEKEADEKMDAEKTNAEKPNADKNPFNENITSTEKYKQLEKWMAVKMTGVIKKFLPFITKLMDIDAKYSKLKNMITTDTVKMLMQKEGQDVEASAIDSNSDRVSKALNSATPKTPRTPYKPLPYFVKIMGKPSLPKRNQMEKFFDQHQPKSIKKHRNIHNLLFVGFCDKESYESMLAANGTVIGRHTLSIRASERSNSEAAKADLNTSTSSDDKLIGSELDEQISDLLSSIRQAEENDKLETINADEKDATNQNGEENNADGATAIADETTANDDGTTANADGTTSNADDTTANSVDNDTATDNVDADTNISETTDADIGAKEESADDCLLEEMNSTESDKCDEKDSGSTEEQNIKQDDNGIAEESADQVPSLTDAKPLGRATPSRISARLATTPGRIQTRRASKLAQNDA